MALGALLILGVVALIPALEAGTRLREARTSMQAARSSLLEGEASAADQAFGEAHADLLQARSAVGNPVLRLFGFLPVVGRSPDATGALVEAGIRVSEAGMILADAVKELPGGAAALAPRNGRIPILPLQQLAGPLGRADALLDEAGGLMEEAPDHWLVPPVADGAREFQPLLEEARGAIGAAAALTRGLPSFLGNDGPKRYFVAAQNPAELRGTGGLIGSYSILVIRNGVLEFGDFRPVSELDTVPPERVDPPNPDYADVWDRFSSRGYWSNINMTPDFPSAAVAIERLYEETEGVRLDGVIATDPFALAALLRVVGAVDVPGTDVQLSAANAVDYLTHDAYTSLPGRARKFVLGDAAEEVLSRFIGGPVGEKSDIPEPGAGREGGEEGGRSGDRSGEAAGEGEPDPGQEDEDPRRARGSPLQGSAGAVAFGRVLVEIAAEGHLLLHSAETFVQEAFEEAGVAGRLPHGAGDFLAVVANAGSGTKIDYYLERAVRYRITLGDDGIGRAVTTVDLTNTAPSSGQPRYVIGPHPFTNNERGENFLYVSTYCAPSCALDGFLRDGQPDGVAPHEELSHPLFQTTSKLPSDTSERLSFRWTVSRAWTDEGGRGIYRLVVDGQPAIRPVELSLSIHVPDGMRVTGTSEGMEVEGDRVLWEGPAGDRMAFEVRFAHSFLGRIWHSVLEFLSQPVIRLPG
jgi:hypothetical protein